MNYKRITFITLAIFVSLMLVLFFRPWRGPQRATFQLSNWQVWSGPLMLKQADGKERLLWPYCVQLGPFIVYYGR